MRISVELIPRDEKKIRMDALAALTAMPMVNVFNVPDLVRFQLRSWDACAIVRDVVPASIPHIRAIDFAPGGTLPVADKIIAAGLTEVLVVRGDPPHDLSQRTYPNTSEDIIHRLKRYHPSLRVYAAFDPYRHGFRTELDSVARKIGAGADGFFTQPMFDLRLLEICAEMLCEHYVFWGIAPVLGQRSKAYWETTNRIIFPEGFVPTLEGNRAFASSAVKIICGLKSNIYFMPIRVDLTKYLEGLI
jgi:methylenetetrahydrofolate reductase (NADPH)